MSTVSVDLQESNFDWRLPSRGRVGMYCLIGAEAAIFTIFVVAYLFYIGKNVVGPNPKMFSMRQYFIRSACSRAVLRYTLPYAGWLRETWRPLRASGYSPYSLEASSFSGPRASGLI